MANYSPKLLSKRASLMDTVLPAFISFAWVYEAQCIAHGNVQGFDIEMCC